MIAARVICIAIGYVLGMFQTGYLYGKLHHVDIRQHGSGNAGATNTLRTLGVKAGLITFFGDLGKAMLAMLIGWLLFCDKYPDGARLLELYAGFGAVLGHNFPFYLKFKGGKGIACTAGLVLTLGPIVTALEATTFLLTVYLSRYVSLGSILVVIELIVDLVVLGQMGYYGMSQAHLIEFYLVCTALSAMAIYRHKTNIVNLLHGTERKIFQK